MHRLLPSDSGSADAARDDEECAAGFGLNFFIAQRSCAQVDTGTERVRLGTFSVHI